MYGSWLIFLRYINTRTYLLTYSQRKQNNRLYCKFGIIDGYLVYSAGMREEVGADPVNPSIRHCNDAMTSAGWRTPLMTSEILLVASVAMSGGETRCNSHNVSHKKFTSDSRSSVFFFPYSDIHYSHCLTIKWAIKVGHCDPQRCHYILKCRHVKRPQFYLQWKIM